ncbi:MAG: hypothetical protein R3B12_02590 [Candidatus Saccharimonadales bacterium]|nr:hypothetical protein [Candidatus Nomurabacteria bacterium]
MKSKINQEISVVSFYNARNQRAQPYAISWQNKDYTVGEIGYHHKVYDGKICHHIFELVDSEQSLWFRLNFNTDNLHWTLEEVSDGNAD